MRLVLAHGIAQEGKDPAALRDEWLGYLGEGIGRDGAYAGHDVTMPYYGDRLAELTAGGAGGAVAQGVGGAADGDEATFLSAALGEQTQAAGIDRRDILAEQRAAALDPVVIEQGFVMDRRINALVRVLEKYSPLHGTVVMRLLRQAYAYMKKPGCGGAIDAIVRPALDAGPAVVVAHSLGTVVTFKLLRQLALEGRPIEVPLLVTVGSPLPLMAIQAALGPAFAVPAGVGRWLNAVDPDDFIALGRGLDETSFAGGIDNILDIDNLKDNAHAIVGYLRDRRVATAVAEACGV